jgi:hypothetical protein
VNLSACAVKPSGRIGGLELKDILAKKSIRLQRNSSVKLMKHKDKTMVHSKIVLRHYRNGEVRRFAFAFGAGSPSRFCPG